MAKLLALDWDQAEARIVVARTKGDGIAVDKTVAVPLSLSPQGDQVELGEQLAAALSQAGVPRCPVVTAVGRSQIELGTLVLPPAPEEELPELVRFQAMREFSSLQENSPLDFFPLGSVGRESGEVVAAAIPRSLADSVTSALTGQGLEPKRAAMRPCAVASLAIRRRPDVAAGVTLVVAQQAESAELVVLKSGVVVFTRSFRLPTEWEPGETGEPMVGEIRRTIAAAQNQLGESRVEKIMLFGTHGQHANLCERLRGRTKLEVELLDAFDGITTDRVPQHSERYAAAIGMLLDEAQEIAPTIDFLNPRKTPEPESPTRKRVFYGGILAAVLLGVAALVMYKFKLLNDEIETYTRRFARIANENKNMESTVALAKQLREWKQADRDWLGELAHLSELEGLTGDDFMLEQIIGQTSRNNEGQLDIKGKARNVMAQQKLQKEWSDEHHSVSPRMSSPIRGNRDSRYPEAFEAIIKTDQSVPIVRVANVPAVEALPAVDDVSPESEGRAQLRKPPVPAETADTAIETVAPEEPEGDTGTEPPTTATETNKESA